MIMKDKLIKTNHRANFYLFRKVILFTLVMAVLAITATVTTYISLSSSLKAEELESTEVVNDNGDTGSYSLSFNE